jgi:hypothetical protein
MDMRTCPHCKQEIPADSHKCHHCREWVNRRYQLKRSLPWAVPLIALCLGFPFLMGGLMQWVTLRERKFWQHPDAIRIVSHHASEGEEDGISIIGTMQNVSATPWRSITIQADYYDSKDQVVDTSGDWSSDTLAPGQRRNFKVVFKKKLRGAEYDHYRVFVAGADDASRF